MNVLRKILIVFITLFSIQSVTSAESQYITAEGEYRLGDRDTRESAKQSALTEAKRRISEQAGVFIKSYTEMNDLQITIDQVQMFSAAIVKILEEKVDYYENGTVCRAIVTAVIDVDQIGSLIDPNSTAPSRSKIPSVQFERDEIFNFHGYKVFDEGISWYQAKKRCEDLGGHLVTITSKQEQAFVQNLLFLKGSQPSYWSGGFFDGDWKWVTGEPFTYTNWNPGEPNHGAEDENMIMIYRASVLGQWNDISPNGNPKYTFYKLASFGFVCEWDNVETPNSSQKNSSEIEGYESLDGHYYRFFDETVDWNQAKKRCEDLGGHLVTINSKSEQALVQNMIFLRGNRNSYWMGGHRDESGNWNWITGEPFIYTNWNSGEPNNAGSRENVMEIRKSVGTWNDVSEDSRYGFICEWEYENDIRR